MLPVVYNRQFFKALAVFTVPVRSPVKHRSGAYCSQGVVYCKSARPIWCQENTTKRENDTTLATMSNRKTICDYWVGIYVRVLQQQKTHFSFCMVVVYTPPVGVLRIVVWCESVSFWFAPPDGGATFFVCWEVWAGMGSGRVESRCREGAAWRCAKTSCTPGVQKGTLATIRVALREKKKNASSG